jgi:hypothetical protein
LPIRPFAVRLSAESPHRAHCPIAAQLCAATVRVTNGCSTDGDGTRNSGLAGTGGGDPEKPTMVASNPTGRAFIGKRREMGFGLFSPHRDHTTSASQANGNGGAFTIGPKLTLSYNQVFCFHTSSRTVSASRTMALPWPSTGATE